MPSNTKAGYTANDMAAGAVAVTPSDSTAVEFYGLYIGTTGNVKVTMLNGDVVTFSTVPVGFMPIAVKLVWSANTTASNIIGLR